MPSRPGALVALPVAAALIGGCTAPAGDRAGAGRSAVTVPIAPVRGTTAHGEATLVQDGGTVRVTARLSGLRPRWSYTLFVAERGDCGGTEPGGARTIPLAGALRTLAAELPRLVSDAHGNAGIVLQVAGSLAATPGDFRGRSLVVQPDGYGRAACGGVPAA